MMRTWPFAARAKERKKGNSCNELRLSLSLAHYFFMAASLSFSTAPPPWAGSPGDAREGGAGSDAPNVASPVKREQTHVHAADVGASTAAFSPAAPRALAALSSSPPPPPPPGPSVAALLDGIAALKDPVASSPVAHHHHQWHDTGEAVASTATLVPGVLDAPAAYAAGAAAGERAALTRAFREALPGREALGTLACAVRLLDARAASAEAAARAAGAGAAAALATATSTSARLAALEAGPVRDLQAAARAAVPDRLAADFKATLTALTAAVEAAHAGAGPGAGLARSARWAASAVVGLAKGALDAADGTALAVSSRVLLDGASRAPPLPEGSADAARAAAARARARALLGGSLFLASVEIAWAAHKAAPLRTPRPLAGGLRRVRQAGWAAALVLGLGAVRAACFSAADAALGAALAKRGVEEKEEEEVIEEGGASAAGAGDS